jgi:HSP20 family protein
MGILKKDGNEPQRQRRTETALARPEQPQMVMRDPFQMMTRDPFQLMREMMIDPFRVFQQMAPWGETREMIWNPSFEVRETDDAFIFKGDMPGVRQEDLEISLVGNNLQITGKREREEEHEEGTVHTYERAFGQFTRTFALPESADVDKLRGDLKDGVLTIVAPKKAGAATHRRKIEIGAGTKA